MISSARLRILFIQRIHSIWSAALTTVRNVQPCFITAIRFNLIRILAVDFPKHRRELQIQIHSRRHKDHIRTSLPADQKRNVYPEKTCLHHEQNAKYLQNLRLPIPASFLTLISMKNLKSVMMSPQPQTSASTFPASVWNRSM